MDICWCGLPVKEKWGYKICDKHGINWRYEPYKPIRKGKYSGKSKRGIKGGYENE